MRKTFEFFELARGSQFKFIDKNMSDTVYISAGVDGAYGRYATNEFDIDNQRWMYCSPLADVEAQL